MHIKINVDDLKQVFKYVLSCIPSKSSHPVLEYLYLKTSENNKIEIIAFNLSAGIKMTVDCVILSSGEILVHAKSLSTIVHSINSDVLEIENMPYEALAKQKDKLLSAENGLIKIKGTNTETQLSSLSTDDYPELDTLKNKDSFSLNKDVAAELLKKVLPAVSKDPSKMVLTGVGVRANNDIINFGAIDGHRLAFAAHEETFSYHSPIDNTSFSFVIPSAQVLILSRIIKDFATPNVDFAFNQSLLSVSGNIKEYAIECFFRLHNGEFPDYLKLVPTSFKGEVTFNKEAALKSLNLIRSLAFEDGPRSKPTCLHITNDKIVLSAEKEGCAVEQIINCKCTFDEDIEIGVNPIYFQEGLATFTSEDVVLSFNDSFSPLIIQGVADLHPSTYLIMPVRLKD